VFANLAVVTGKTPTQIASDAATTFNGWSVEVVSTYFDSTIKLHHPEKCGTLEGRLRHLTHNNPPKGTPSLAVHKCKWLPAVPDTVTNPHAVLWDRIEGKHAFARRYRCGTIHLVLFQKIKDNQTGVKSNVVITQFPYQQGERQDFFTVDWKK